MIFIRSFRNALPRSWTDKQKINFIVGLLQAEASSWGSDAEEKYTNYEDFEAAFLNKFWSETIQEKIRKEILSPEPFHANNGNLRRYFEKYLQKGKHLNPELRQTEIIRALKNKLPKQLRMQLALVSDKDTEKFLETLDNLDLAQEDYSEQYEQTSRRSRSPTRTNRRNRQRSDSWPPTNRNRQSFKNNNEYHQYQQQYHYNNYKGNNNGRQNNRQHYSQWSSQVQENRYRPYNNGRRFNNNNNNTPWEQQNRQNQHPRQTSQFQNDNAAQITELN